MIDIVFTTVPYTDTKLPMMAPAVLKSIAVKASKTAVTEDLNVQLINYVRDHPHRDDILEFFKSGFAVTAVQQEVFDILYQYAKQLLSHQPKIVSLSVFTYHCQIATKYLSLFIKELSPSTRILIGGAGLVKTLIGSPIFAKRLVSSGLVDFYIRGDGETALYDYLTSTQETIDDNWKELDNSDLLELPTPDYDDYDFSVYETDGIPILGSRGCVQKCTFCDIHSHWTKFSFRSGQHIFEEMLELCKKYGIYKFTFQDSLINGNFKEYKALMTLVANHNNNVEKEKRLIWSSFFILRKEKIFNEEQWKLTAEGGGVYLVIGIESFSDESRKHLGKNFTNEDIEFALQMAKKYNIKLVLLYLIGYVTETEQDQLNAIKWLEDHYEEYHDTVIINLGSSLGITEGTPLRENFEALKLVKVDDTDQGWSNPATGNTPKRRTEWYLQLQETVERLGYKQIINHDNRYILERMMRDHK